MAERQSMTTPEVVANTLITEHSDFLREAVAAVAAQLMEAEISAQIGAAKGEITEARTSHRNGYRPRPWATRVGEIELAVPRKRSGESYFPSFKAATLEMIRAQGAIVGWTATGAELTAALAGC